MRKRKVNLLAIFVLIFAFVLTGTILSFGNLNTANAYTSSNLPANNVGSLTLSGYDSRSDGLVFDKSALAKLYGAITGKTTNTYANALSAVNGSTSTQYSHANGTTNYPNTQVRSMNFTQIKNANTANSNRAITLQFGGFTWNVVYLTTNTNTNNGGRAGDLIATLWMSDTNGTSKWSGFTTDSHVTSSRYTQGEYSTSYVHIAELNGGGDSGRQYATSPTTGANSPNNRKTHKYSAFTMSENTSTGVGSKSLTRFLATPRQVNYQKDENMQWSCKNSGGAYNTLNEAWDAPPSNIRHFSTSTNSNVTTSLMSDGSLGYDNYVQASNKSIHPEYDKWADDFLWLPSATELGCVHDGTHNIHTFASIWGVPGLDAIYSNNSSINFWVRGTHWSDVTQGAFIASAGGCNVTPHSTSVLGIRPALHLNLTKAQENISVNDPGTAQSREYNGSIQKLDSTKETWFTTDFQNKVDLKYYDTDGTAFTGSNGPQNAGTYKVGFTPKSGRTWADGTTTEKKIDFIITKKQLDFPSIAIDSKPYTGGSKIFFDVNNPDKNAIKLTVHSDFVGIIIWNNDSYQQVEVVKGQVGDYYLAVEIDSGYTNNYEFKSADQGKTELHFSVIPATVDLDLHSGTSHALSGAQGGSVTAKLSINLFGSSNHILSASDSIAVTVCAQRDANTLLPIGTATFTGTAAQETDVTLDLSRLTQRTYPIVLTTTNGNYTLALPTATTLEVQSAGYRPGFTWVLYSDSVPTSKTMNAAIGDDDITFGETITYDGKHFEFRVIPPSDYNQNVTYTVSTNALSGSDPNVGKYCDTYSTIATVTDGSGGRHEYSITWTISKAKFDLSNVRWQNDGKLPYNPSGSFAVLDPSTIPTGLSASYSTNDGHSINQTGTANVSFTLTGSEYINNYVLPISSDSTTYTFTSSGSLTDFEWSKAWTVVKAIIPVSFDPGGTYTDKNGVNFTAPKLADSTYADQIEYRFYETDSNGNVLDPSVYLLADQIEVSDNALKYYKVKPAVKSNVADRYELENENYSNHFSLGSYSEAVEIDLANATLTYNGKAQSVVINVISGGISESQFDIVYYDRNGVTPLTSAPTNVGLYTVQIKIKSGVNGYYLSGSNVTGDTAIIDYEIVKRTIDNSTWVTSHNPPSLQLSFADTQQVQYEYADMDGNTLAFNQLAPGNTYKVRARIKDMNNCEFATADASGDVFNTDWVEFTVSENEQLYDPLDPNNPFYPEDPDNPTNPDNPDNPDNPGNGIGDKIKEFFDNLIKNNFPLWQIATIAAGALLTLIFMIKAIQYGNRRKKAKGEAKKISAKTYAAFLPVFDTTLVLAGLSNKVWSIIAFAMVGVTVLMFLIAILTRRGWKKAELAKEQAIEDSEQRRIDADRQEREAEKQERREFQERMVQVGSSGGAFSADGINLEEILRKRDEEHRREIEEMREEQAKRDEAMKIMLANLMGRQQGVDGDMSYAAMDDTDLLVQKVIAGLLPAVQQMMPEPTAYLAAPSQETEELKDLIAQQSAKIDDLQNQLADMSHNVYDAEIIPDNSEEIRALKEEHSARIDEQNAQIEEQNNQIAEQNAQIADLQNRIDELMQGRVEAELLPDQSEEIKILTEQIEQLKSQIENSDGVTVVDNSDEIEALKEAHSAEMNAQNAKLAQQNAEMQAMSAEMLAMRSQLEALSSMSVDELDDEDFDDEEEWDSILDEDDDDFVEAVIIDDNGKERKVYPNFRMRLKQSSDKNREWYAVIKNLFCSQKGVTYRVYKRVEKIRYQGQVIAVIGIAKRSIKLWLALKPYEYDARRYHHKDVSDKPRFVDVPMYVRITSDRALDRSQELILALFQELNMEARKRYTDRPIQELIFTLKHNRLLTNKQNKQLLCEVMHVHDCDVLDDETAEKCIEAKNVEFIDDSNIETVKLDDIDAKFQDGNRVTLDRLKKVGLVSEDCTGYTVTADKRLTKPLIIVANDFTLTAVKLITLTGGRTIRLQTV